MFLSDCVRGKQREEEEERKRSEGNGEDAAVCLCNCRRKRRKQLINQHRKETGIQTAETDRWGRGGRASPLSLCTAGCCWQSAVSLCTSLSSPLSTLRRTICPSLWLSGPRRGIYSRQSFDTSLNILWTLSAVLFFYVSEERNGRVIVDNSHRSLGAPRRW